MNEDQINETRPSDVSAVSTTSSTRRRKTAKEQLQNALAIQNDYKNRNIVTDPDREEDEFVCFIGEFYRAKLTYTASKWPIETGNSAWGHFDACILGTPYIMTHYYF